tara:strand:+ start:1786 stop:2013 length:228 start_codon:yes stop_codon:yes gene_type:complete
MQYRGRKTTLDDGSIQVELLADDEVRHTEIAQDDGGANAYIIPWVAQEGYTNMDVTDATHTVDWDNFDSLYLYQG